MLKGSQQREELDVTQVFTGSFWLLVGKSWVGGLEWELGGGEEAPTVVQTKNRQVDRMGWAMGTGKWVDSVYSLKMELTEFFEELGVRCEDKEESAGFLLACAAGGMEVPLTEMQMTGFEYYHRKDLKT